MTPLLLCPAYLDSEGKPCISNLHKGRDTYLLMKGFTEYNKEYSDLYSMAPSSAYTKATASQDLSTYTSRMLQLPLEFQGPQRARVHPPAWAQYTAPGLGTGGQGSHLPKKESLWKWHLDKRVKKNKASRHQDAVGSQCC